MILVEWGKTGCTFDIFAKSEQKKGNLLTTKVLAAIDCFAIGLPKQSSYFFNLCFFRGHLIQYP